MNPKEKISSFFNALFVQHRNIKLFDSSERVVGAMKPAEKMLFYLLVGVALVSSLLLVRRVHQYFLVEVPAFGGSFTEGVVGSPRFINPVLAISDTDKDISTLVYAGLLKATTDGKYAPDLASAFSISEDGMVYDFHIKEDAFFHNGVPVTSDDIIFTIEKTLDQVIKSPKRTNWEGVTLEKVSDKEIRFILKKPYSPFMEALTIGILPKAVWESATPEEFPFSQWNISPIGAGPYKVDTVKRNSAGIATSITLTAWNKYSGNKPHIKSITFKFFQNEGELIKAYGAQEIDSAADLSEQAGIGLARNSRIITSSLPRVFAVFLNQNSAPVFLNKEVRQALDKAAPKDRIVKEILGGFGSVALGPIPSEKRPATDTSGESGIEEAKAILADAGWTPDENGILKKKIKSETVSLAFSISTSDTPDLKEAAEALKAAWEQLGASVEIKIFEAGDLNQNIIRPRKYDALLFGEVVNTEGDLYPFWHSSQRIDPGLNISLYTNITTDKILESLRTETSPETRAEDRSNLSAEIMKDMPAIFLFVPDLLYIPAPQVKNVSLKSVSSPNERFSGIDDWFIETDKVWSFFASPNS